MGRWGSLLWKAVGIALGVAYVAIGIAQFVH